MTNTEIKFRFQSDAWNGIVESLCDAGGYQALVPNPDYSFNTPTEPMQIANPVTKEQFATKHIVDYVGRIFSQWSIRENMKPVQEQVAAAAAARVAEVAAATVIEVVTVE